MRDLVRRRRRHSAPVTSGAARRRALRRRRLVTGGVAGALVLSLLGGGVALATRSGSTGYTTAIAAVAGVDQTIDTTGTVASATNLDRSFSVAGTVGSVDVAVGDTVTAVDGSTLTIDAVSMGRPGDDSADAGTASTVVTVADTTTYTATAAADATAITVGRCVVAQGDQDDSGQMTATSLTLSDATDGSCSTGFGGRPQGGDDSDA